MKPIGPYFGEFLGHMQQAVHTGGSELAVGLELFSRTAGSRAKTVLETGRYRGFSGLAIAGGLRLLDDGWQDPDTFRGRPDVDYAQHEATVDDRILYSVDPLVDPAADELWAKAGVSRYIKRYDCKSADVPLDELRPLDGVFVDGDHSLEGCQADVDKFLNILKPGGWMVLHDYFGWHHADGRNGSPIAECVHRMRERTPRCIIVDTGYPSFAVLIKPNPRTGV